MNAYDIEVRRIAEILAKVRYDKERKHTGYLPFDQIDNENKEDRIDYQIEPARAMVSEMAKQYEFAYFSNYDGTEESADYVLWNENCISEMQDRGLIPDSAKEGETDG